jgi:two-component system phosphate regulon sensor histidine kinase PhoR
VGAVRTSRSLAALEQALAALHRALFLAALLAAALILAVSALIARRLRRGLAALARGAERLAEEDLSHLVPRDGIRELHAVGEALNRLAERFGERLAAALRQLAEHEAVLAGMVEGVLAVDPALRILSMNPAAARLFGTDPAAARGRSLLEVARNADLERFVALAAGAREPVEAEISVHKQDERRVSLHGNVLYDAAGRALGALIVLNDVTTLRRLENMRRDFVANVSHELKTPITSIQGFVETLVAGKAQTPEEGDRFLRIVQRQAERLGAIIDDLLNLSRIERDTETGEIALQWAELEPVLLAAVQGCEVQARAKEIALELRTAPGLAARVNGPLLEQALVNLIDNAVKYSPEGGRVQVEAGETPEGIALRVQDWGSGIPPQHLPRLFERFYRVDKARSRKLGGTGLGLAIVKHIAQAHGGQARVDSAPGEGSTFTILLPRA